MEADEQDLNDLTTGKIKIDKSLLSTSIGKCLLIFTIQMLLIYLALQSFKNMTETEGSVYGIKVAKSFEILMVRLLCAIFLHV